MQQVGICILLTLLISLAKPIGASNLIAAKSNSSLLRNNDKFSDMLESQISGAQALDPTKAIKSLQKAGIIEQKFCCSYNSHSYFKTCKPLTVWGLTVISVFGYAESPMFYPGRVQIPGITKPQPPALGVVVPYPETAVKSKLSSLGLHNVEIQLSWLKVLTSSTRKRSPMQTEIIKLGAL